MQITVGKNGTKIKLTKAEERKLVEAAKVAKAIANHAGDDETELHADAIMQSIEALLAALREEVAAKAAAATA